MLYRDYRDLQKLLSLSLLFRHALPVQNKIYHMHCQKSNLMRE